MKTLLRASLASLLFSLVATAVPATAQEEPPLTCEDYRCQFQARLDAECPCAEQKNHGQYVRCVAHIVNDLTKDGLPTNCKGKLKRCAAKSICGKQERGFATCTTIQYGTCVASACDNDPTVACTVDTDCVVSSECRFTRSAENCEGAGGLVNLSPTCCSTCNTAAP